MTFQGTIFDARELLPELHPVRGFDRDTLQSDPVLVWIAGKSDGHGHRLAGWLVARCFRVSDKSGYGHSWRDNADDDNELSGVTHWTPLPPAPAKGE